MKKVIFDDKGHYLFMILSLLVWDFVHDYHPQSQIGKNRLANCLHTIKYNNVEVLGILEISNGIKRIYDDSLRLYGGREVAAENNYVALGEQRLFGYKNISPKNKHPTLIKYEKATSKENLITMEKIENNPNIDAVLGNFNFHMLSSISFEYERNNEMNRDFRYKEIFKGIYKYIYDLKELSENNIGSEIEKKEDLIDIKIVKNSLVILSYLFIDMFIEYAFNREKIHDNSRNTGKDKELNPYSLFFDFLKDISYRKKSRILLCIIINENNRKEKNKKYKLGSTKELIKKMNIVVNSLDKLANKEKKYRGGESMNLVSSSSLDKLLSNTLEEDSSEELEDESKEINLDCSDLIKFKGLINDEINKTQNNDIDLIKNNMLYTLQGIESSLRLDKNIYGINSNDINNVKELLRIAKEDYNKLINVLNSTTRRISFGKFKDKFKAIMVKIEEIYKKTSCATIVNNLNRRIKREAKEEFKDDLKKLPKEAQIYVSHIHRMIGKKVLLELDLIEKVNNNEYMIIEDYNNLYLRFLLEIIAGLSRIKLVNPTEGKNKASSMNSLYSAGDLELDKFKALIGISSRDIDSEVFTRYKKIILKETYANLNSWQRTQVARHEDRPKANFYIKKIFSQFTLLSGDRYFGDDKSVIAGFGLHKDIENKAKQLSYTQFVSQGNDKDVEKWDNNTIGQYLDLFEQLANEMADNSSDTDIVEEVFGEVSEKVVKQCPECNKADWIEDNRQKKAEEPEKFGKIPSWSCSTYQGNQGCGWVAWGDTDCPKEWL